MENRKWKTFCSTPATFLCTFLLLCFFFPSLTAEEREDQAALVRIDKAGCGQFDVSATAEAYLEGPDIKHMVMHGIIVTYDPKCVYLKVVKK